MTTKTPTASAASSKQMKNSKFHKLFLQELKDIYWAEKQLVKALPKMKDASTSLKLSKAIGSHLEETEEHVNRLEKVFRLLDERAQAKKCEAMEGLLAEATTIVEDTKSDTMVRDAGIIIACQKVEHYEIASYGSLVELAKKMEHTECARVLAQTLEEEKKTDKKLTKLAESEINEKALQE
ncbi:ferritin-like domain-containing protein [Algoriphagus sp. AGSA1]|uniref:YciE/YciF ferroxidase family protein n=1 Tax=Algoriphagus sp. AGSA1 TaxID=2907213 RepID=UPI001F303679|nr:ferritin-like domain-containing protein [Algoriphagus sp. AGSA1]MCE7054665.1 ferritin-like domain-containing protein [Algoriphagus sp. AGSA1]